MEAFRVFFAYFTPEVTLPVASAVATGVGFILLVARAPIRIVGESFRRAVRGLRSIVDKLEL